MLANSQKEMQVVMATELAVQKMREGMREEIVVTVRAEMAAAEDGVGSPCRGRC